LPEIRERKKEREEKERGKEEDFYHPQRYACSRAQRPQRKKSFSLPLWPLCPLAERVVKIFLFMGKA
jgi:hypothetical protein